VLEALARGGCRVVVVGHSMGCRVALHALAQPPRTGGAQRRPPLAAELHLAAAAVGQVITVSTRNAESGGEGGGGRFLTGICL
jgi:pimeloyl-ACP methyl ester carboxylesterase